ncbi:MAG TPA: efflux RND transporter periplasmic adaptor subunit [Candidatus Blautia gallistercoris]|uniref:Efflux RND transporter periplasmic adaptor subunit n=1 Tax=Candidatus Blautia gallistercoris TaxID=2838490 RepID=A0A9D2B391_9FIRM|nr:efflux RND transporter periplasmic adaptor subunit [Candidatus Blautia gallistercoris]
MKKKQNKVMIGIAAGVVVIAGALLVINQNAGAAETVPSVEVVAVSRGDVSQELDATGTVESQKKKTFFSPVNATIENMNVTAGDMVKKGEKLITFNLEDLEKENTRAELNALSGQYDTQNTIKKSNEAAAKQANAQANVDTLEGQVASWKQYVSDLRDRIAQVNAEAQAAAQQQTADAQAAVAEQEKQLQEQYQADLKVYQQETLPQYQSELKAALKTQNEKLSAYNQADMEYQLAFQTWSSAQTPENQAAVNEKEAVRTQAQIDLQTAQEAYQALEANPPEQPQKPQSLDEGAVQWGDGSLAGSGTVTADTSALQAELEEASSTLAELQSELASQEAVAESDAGTLTAEERAKLDVTNNLSELETKSTEELIEEGRKGIKAEFDGVISEASVTEGAAVTQGMQMFTLQSTEDVCVSINISKYDFDKLKEGQKADITLGSFSYEGTVEKISRIASVNEKGASMINAQVKIDNPDENIFLGVDAKVVVHAATAEDALLVPNSVINIGKDGSFCYVVEDGVIVGRPVETGIASDSETEILSGLDENDAVITDIGNFEEGDAVEAVAQETEQAAE